MKIYTRTGDDGTTGLLGGSRVRKDSARIEACGAVDELNALVGVIIAGLPASAHKVRPWLDSLQSDLFVAGTVIATPATDPRSHALLAPAQVTALENRIDELEKDLPPLKNFILPQGTLCASYIHLARAVCRRAERRIVTVGAEEKVEALVSAFLNRVSDFLFVLARWVNRRENGVETAWINALGGAVAGGAVADRMDATLQKLNDDKQKRQTLFERAASDLDKKKKEAEQLFRQGVDQIKKDGGKVEKPLREMDLD